MDHAGTCDPDDTRPRIQRHFVEAWPLRSYYGYGVAFTMRVHRGACPLADEVLKAEAYALAERRG